MCVEIVSPSNSEEEMREKTEAYLAAGAREVWVMSEEGGVRFFETRGERGSSSFAVVLSPSARGRKA